MASNAKCILRLARAFPWQPINRRVVALSAISLFRQVYLFAVIVPDTDAVLISDALSVDASSHRLGLYSASTNLQ